jgi:5-methylcytosine-specific restriction endonuclease McrA
MNYSAEGIIRTNVQKSVPAMLEHPGTWSNLYWRSGMSILTPKKRNQEKLKAWKAKNRDRINQLQTLRRKNNPEHTRELDRKYRRLHPEAEKEKNRKYRAAHKEKRKLTRELWMQRHPEKNSEYLLNRRARMLGGGGKVTSQEWQALKEKYNFTCLCCRRSEPEIKLTQDHIKPLVMGGKHAIDNIQPLCKPCNSKKHDKWIDYREN